MFYIVINLELVTYSKPRSRVDPKSSSWQCLKCLCKDMFIVHSTYILSRILVLIQRLSYWILTKDLRFIAK
jgi:hypothetical protein